MDLVKLISKEMDYAKGLGSLECFFLHDLNN